MQNCLNRETTRYKGYLLMSSGLPPDPRKVEAILQMPVPDDKKALQRALGMITYQMRFCSNEIPDNDTTTTRRLQDFNVDDC